MCIFTTQLIKLRTATEQTAQGGHMEFPLTVSQFDGLCTGNWELGRVCAVQIIRNSAINKQQNNHYHIGGPGALGCHLNSIQ